MADGFRAWIELLKMIKGTRVKTFKKQIHNYYRSNIIRSLEREGWFEYLKIPRTFEEIRNNFNYTDNDFLSELLNVLVNDNTLNITKDGLKYQTNPPVEENRMVPSFFADSVKEILENYAESLPDRLKGKFQTFAGGMNLFNWDDIMGMKFYGYIRKCAFLYSGAFKRTGKLLDLGCGNGYGTTAIWLYYYKRNYFIKENNIEIIGMDINKDLLKIAEEESLMRLKPHLEDINIDKIDSFLPKYVEGSAINIPYADNTFDMVYASQILQWTNAERAINEMYRVTKPGGFSFGTQGVYPTVDRYMDLTVKIAEDTTGFFHKKDLIHWAENTGAKNVETATPIILYKITK